MPNRKLCIGKLEAKLGEKRHATSLAWKSILSLHLSVEHSILYAFYTRQEYLLKLTQKLLKYGHLVETSNYYSFPSYGNAENEMAFYWLSCWSLEFPLPFAAWPIAQLQEVKVTQPELGKIEAVRHLTYLGDWWSRKTNDPWRNKCFSNKR